MERLCPNGIQRSLKLNERTVPQSSEHSCDLCTTVGLPGEPIFECVAHMKKGVAVPNSICAQHAHQKSQCELSQSVGMAF